MFLTSMFRCVMPKLRHAKAALLLRSAAGVVACLVSVSCTEEPPCRLYLPVYDQFGDRLHQFRVTRLTPLQNPQVNLLALFPHKVRRAGNDQLIVDRSLLGRELQVTLEDQQGARITQPLFFTECFERVSFRVGLTAGYGDSVRELVIGRLTGCRFTGDWWVRAINMFGPWTAPAIPEARVEENGSFRLKGYMLGERHIVVIGKDKWPVEAVGVNIQEGGINDLGTLDLSGRCPP